MHRLAIRPSGASLSGGGVGAHKRAKRQAIKGWSAAAARRHKNWLQSVVPDQLDGLGLAITLTVALLPADADEWHDALHAFAEACRRLGMIRGHWVTEDQRRGVPHFHLAVYFEEGPFGRSSTLLMAQLVQAWCRIAAPWGAVAVAQHVALIEGGTGWAKYCAKHSSRSVRHVQRAGLPDGWTTSGKLWGIWGEWPVAEDRYLIDGRTWVQLRRLLVAWRRADAAAALRKAQSAVAHTAPDSPWRRVKEHHVRTAADRVRHTRRPLWTPPADTVPEKRAMSRSAGLNEWIPADVLDRAIRWLLAESRAVEPVWGTGRPDRTGRGGIGAWVPMLELVVDVDQLESEAVVA